MAVCLMVERVPISSSGDGHVHLVGSQLHCNFGRSFLTFPVIFHPEFILFPYPTQPSLGRTIETNSYGRSFSALVKFWRSWIFFPIRCTFRGVCISSGIPLSQAALLQLSRNS